MLLLKPPKSEGERTGGVRRVLPTITTNSRRSFRNGASAVYPTTRSPCLWKCSMTSTAPSVRPTPRPTGASSRSAARKCRSRQIRAFTSWAGSRRRPWAGFAHGCAAELRPGRSGACGQTTHRVAPMSDRRSAYHGPSPPPRAGIASLSDVNRYNWDRKGKENQP
jgi:hypothetical protein